MRGETPRGGGGGPGSRKLRLIPTQTVGLGVRGWLWLRVKWWSRNSWVANSDPGWRVRTGGWRDESGLEEAAGPPGDLKNAVEPGEWTKPAAQPPESGVGRISQMNWSRKGFNISEALHMFSRRLSLNFKFKDFDQFEVLWWFKNNHATKWVVGRFLNVHYFKIFDNGKVGRLYISLRQPWRNSRTLANEKYANSPHYILVLSECTE